MCTISKKIILSLLLSVLAIEVNASKVFLFFGQLIRSVSENSLINHSRVPDPHQFALWTQIVHLLFWTLMTFLIILLFLNCRKRRKLNEKMVHFIQAVYDLQKPLEMIKGPLEDLSKEYNINDTQKTKLDVAIWTTTSIQSTISNLIEQAKSDRFFYVILNSAAGKKIQLKEKIEAKFNSFKQVKKSLKKANRDILPGSENQTDVLFMEKLMTILKTNIEDTNFTIDTLSQKIGMSRSSLYHKIKDISGLAPADFIRIYRLEKAKELLEKHQYTISEVAYKTGFSDAKYFRAVFKKQYHTPPGTYSKTV